MAVYELPMEPNNPVQNKYSGVVYSYWSDRNQWVSKDGLSAYSWRDLLEDAGPLQDYEPKYRIVVNHNRSLDEAWNETWSKAGVEAVLENYAKGLDMSQIKLYRRGSELITDTTSYVIEEA